MILIATHYSISAFSVWGLKAYCLSRRTTVVTDHFLVPSCPELSRCSPRSQPNTRSLRMPRCFSFCLVGRDFMKVLRKPISLPCFLDTARGGRQRATELICKGDASDHKRLQEVPTGLFKALTIEMHVCVCVCVFVCE